MGIDITPHNNTSQSQSYGATINIYRRTASISIPLPHCFVLFHSQFSPALLSAVFIWVASTAYPRIARVSAKHTVLIEPVYFLKPNTPPMLGCTRSRYTSHALCIIANYAPITLTTQRFSLMPLCVIHYLPW